MRIGRGLLGGQDDLFAGLGADVRQVAENAEPVHLGDHLTAEIG
jgi:hypothetical protein